MDGCIFRLNVSLTMQYLQLSSMCSGHCISKYDFKHSNEFLLCFIIFKKLPGLIFLPYISTVHQTLTSWFTSAINTHIPTHPRLSPTYSNGKKAMSQLWLAILEKHHVAAMPKWCPCSDIASRTNDYLQKKVLQQVLFFFANGQTNQHNCNVSSKWG